MTTTATRRQLTDTDVQLGAIVHKGNGPTEWIITNHRGISLNSYSATLSYNWVTLSKRGSKAANAAEAGIAVGGSAIYPLRELTVTA